MCSLFKMMWNISIAIFSLRFVNIVFYTIWFLFLGHIVVMSSMASFLTLPVVWYFERVAWYFVKGDVVLWNGGMVLWRWWCGTLKWVVWYFDIIYILFHTYISHYLHSIFSQAADYCASKVCVRVLAEGLRPQLARDNVGCTVICPGFVQVYIFI